MIYGYARVSTDGQSVDAQVKQLRAAGAEKVFRETASRAKSDRAQLRRALDHIGKGDVLMVTRLDRLARSTRDLLNTVEAIATKKAGFKSLGDTWADTTTAHGRLMLTVLGGLAEFERDLIRARTGEGRDRAEGAGREDGAEIQTHRPPAARGDQTPRHEGGAGAGDCPDLQRLAQHDFTVEGMSAIILHRTDPARNMRRLDVQPDLFGHRLLLVPVLFTFVVTFVVCVIFFVSPLVAFVTREN